MSIYMRNFVTDRLNLMVASIMIKSMVKKCNVTNVHCVDETWCNAA